MKASHDNRRSKEILRALMDPEQPDMVPWSSSELRAMLEHQLATPLASERERFAELAHCSLEQVLAIIEDSSCHTFGDVFSSGSPPIEVVVLVKDFAKAALAEEGDLPKDVARVVYVMAIMCGREVSTNRISSLDDATVEREVRRCLTFGWLPGNIRQSLRHKAGEC